jgi:t-SNARE complex subunit (syntaxin)
MSLEESFNKAAEGLAKTEAPQGQATEAPEAAKTQNTGQAEATTQTAPDTTSKETKEREWDGKPETLPTELKQDPKAIQRAYTRKAMALSDAEKKLKEYEGFNKEELNAYRQWKQQQELERQQKLVQQPVAPIQLTPEQLEAVKNDPNLFNQYVQSLVNAQVQQAAQTIVPEIQRMKYDNAVSQWERVIADFGEVHPDMWEMHEAGLFQPILDSVVEAGGTLEDAYSQASKIKEAFRVKADMEAQARVQAKREASSNPGTSSATDDVVFVDDSRSVIEKAFDLAVSKKEFVPKDATVSPRGRVKVRKK